MDPKLMMKLMDPAVRADPEAMKRLAQETRREVRREVLGSVRLNGIVMTVVGGLLVVAGLACGVLALVEGRPGGPAGAPYPFLALLLGGMGAVFAVLGRVFSVPGEVKNGALGMATVKEVRGVGRSISIQKPGLTASLTKLTLLVSVTPPSGAAFDAVFSELVPSSDMMRLQLGAEVPVRIDPKKPTRFSIDWERFVR